MERKSDGTSRDDDEIDINNELDKLPQEFQDIIAAYSNFFLEEDVLKEYKDNPNKIQEFRSKLAEFGLNEKAVKIAFKVYGLPDLDISQLNKNNEK